ncbi:MAG: NAD(P)/FAD-dependent oxidoreductase [Gemmatimonadota bacterium]|jgi:flavin-dependent dehydrogenase
MHDTGMSISRRHYDVVIAGARCAGASTAMLLARRGLRVLAVDPVESGRDTLSTHALMRGAVLQLHRWGLLDAVRSAGTPAIRTTSFHYGDETITIPIKPRDGMDALYAPRRTVLDPLLVEGARAAGAEVVHGHGVVDLLRDPDGRVHGATVADRERRTLDVSADLVVGADGVRSRVARILDVDVDYATPNAGATVYGYWRGIGLEGNHWFYDVGAGVGAIPTNGGATCVFAGFPRERFARSGGAGLEALMREVLEGVSPDLAARVEGAERQGKLRGFAGIAGFLRRSTGPGWALVGDAGYFRDPITAHGITDALRDAEALARAVTEGDGNLARYQDERDELVRDLLDITDRISTYDWTLDEVKGLHLDLSREMKAEVEWMRRWDEGARASAPLESLPQPA